MKGFKKYIGLVSLLLISNETIAQTISWSPLNATDVPLSNTALLLLGLSLFITAKYFTKSRQFVKNNVFIITAISGLLLIGGTTLDKKALAVIAASIVNISTPSGTEHLAENDTTQVTNNFANPIRITAVDPELCTITANTCTVGTILNNGDTCNVTTSCTVTDSEAPVSENIIVSALGSETASGSVSAIDNIDPSPEIILESSPDHGIILFSGMDFSYTGTEDGYVGLDTATFKVRDISGNLSITYTITINDIAVF